MSAAVPGFADVAEKLRRSTVHLSAGRRGHGSGIIVKPDGMIVTNAHVAAFGPLRAHLWDGTTTEADLLWNDGERDLAVLRVPRSDLPAATLGDSDRLRVGELVIAIGNPLGFVGALTTGVVHAVGRVPNLGPRKWIQADVRLAPGNSGGPLADARGQVIGVNTMIARGVGLAVPSNSVARLLSADAHSQLGIVAHPVQIVAGGKERLGLVIAKIAAGSAAAAASLMLGDVVIGVEGEVKDGSFDSLEDFERAIDGGDNAGDNGERTLRLQFLRGDRQAVRSVVVRLGVAHSAAA